MLNKEDLKAIEQLMRKVVEENNGVLRLEMSDMKTELRSEFRYEMSELKRDIEKTIEVKLEESEEFLLDEMERYYNMAKKDHLNLEEKVDRIDRYYSIRRLEDEERDLKLQLHQEAIDDIKERLAM